LFGFLTDAERDLFRLLIQHVTGVGPKIALALLSGMSVGQFKTAVVQGDLAALAKISGLGKKTAERIVLELKDKIGVAASWELAGSTRDEKQARGSDAVLALLSLGFKQVEAQKAVREILSSQETGDIDTEELVRRALKRLA
jgi:Holliday junction DNA helicase RuvA